jgi:hypothetical protein
MSVRQNVFTYLEKGPEAPLNEVLAAFSNLKESTIRRYFFEFQKLDKKTAKSQKKKSERQNKTTETDVKTVAPPQKKLKKNTKLQIYGFMQSAPETKLRELVKAFPDLQKTTIGNYRRQWLKEQGSPKQALSKSKRSEILSFLDNNPASNINDLKKVFPDVANKLVTVFRSWKNSQAAAAIPDKEKITATSKPIGAKGPATKEKTSSKQNWLEKHQDTIARQKEIIEKQKTRIEILRSQLPSAKKTGIIDTIRNFIIDKLSKK